MTLKTYKVSLLDVKKALKDSRFRDILPEGLKDAVNQYLDNPGCACNTPLYRKILKECRKELSQYFPNREIEDEEEVIAKLSENNWSVVNCTIDELEDKLRSLPPGRKQLAVARYQDQITLIVNELDIVF